MLSFPDIETIRKEHGQATVTDEVYANAKADYERKLQTETALLAQFKTREGLTEEEAVKIFCEFLIRESVYLASHTPEEIESLESWKKPKR